MYLYSAISRLWIYSVFIHLWTFTYILFFHFWPLPFSALFIYGLYLYSVIILFWPLPIFCHYSFLAFTYILLYSFLAFTYILSLFISFLFCKACLLSYFLQYYPPANECNKIFISILYLSPPTYEQHQNLLEDWLEHVLLFKHRANLCIGWLVLQIIKHFSLAANALAYSDHTTLLSKIHWMIFRVERIAN